MNRVVEITDDLVRDAMEATGAASEREAIELAIKTYVSQHRKDRKRKNMFDLVGEDRKSVV